MKQNHHRSRPGRVALAFVAAATIVTGACSESGTDPEALIIDEGPAPAAVLSSSWVADVNMTKRTVKITAPQSGLNASRVMADYFGVDPQAELSLIGGDVIDVLPVPGTLNFAPANLASGRRRVAFQLQIQNKLSGTGLKVPQEFPAAPAGVTSPVIFAFRNVVTTTTGGVTGQQGQGNEVIVETPNQGNVITTDSIWDGPPHNFFNDAACPTTGETGNGSDCFLFLPIVEEGSGRDTIDGLSQSEPIRVGYDLELTVNNFRSNLIVGADLIDATPNALPTAAFAATNPPCYVGVPLNLNGSTSADSDGFISSYQWTDGANPGVFTPNATDASVSYTAGAPGPVGITLQVTDNRGGTDDVLQTFNCTNPPSDVTVTKSIVGGPNATQGSTITYRVVASETLGGAANSVVVTDTLPTNATLVGGSITDGGTVSAGVITWNLGNRAGLFSEILEFQMTVTPATAGSTLRNATAITSSTDTNGGNNTFVLTSNVVGAPNFLGRWVFVSGSQAAGTPLLNGGSVKNGDVLDFQQCILGFDVNAAEIRTSWDNTRLSLPSAASAFDADQASPTRHPDCVSANDELDDFFSSSAASQNVNNLTSDIDLDAPTGASTEGLGSYRFTVTGTAGQNIVLTHTGALVSDHVSGTVPTGNVLVNYHSLVIVP